VLILDICDFLEQCAYLLKSLLCIWMWFLRLLPEGALYRDDEMPMYYNIVWNNADVDRDLYFLSMWNLNTRMLLETRIHFMQPYIIK
jgi:hypothetical protein